jgi:hypothetical protein
VLLGLISWYAVHSSTVVHHLTCGWVTTPNTHQQQQQHHQQQQQQELLCHQHRVPQQQLSHNLEGHRLSVTAMSASVGG